MRIQSKRLPVMRIDDESPGIGGGRTRYVIDTEISSGGEVSVLLSEESVRDLGSRHEEVVGADRICLDVATARWLLEKLPAVIAQAQAIEDEIWLSRGGEAAAPARGNGRAA